ncbi:MAG TPA: dihydrofolate reductase [Methanosarcinales archaeon]|nr:dihydrofolate reductase [Methanosarcinales archaeon]
MHPLIIIAAYTKDHVIGNKGKLPWNIPAEMKHFIATTERSRVIVGRKTFESMHKSARKRCIVLTHNKEMVNDTHTASSLSEAVSYCELQYKRDKWLSDARPIFIAGGASVYEQAMPYADRMYLSFIHKQYEGDAFFPKWNNEDWSEFQVDTSNEEFEIVTYFRKVAPQRLDRKE